MRFLFLFIVLFIPNYFTLASSIYFEGGNNINVNQKLTLPIVLDTEGELINTIDIEIYFNNQLLDFVGFKENDSFQKKWIFSPTLKENKIVFSMLIPGGINGLYDSSIEGRTPIKVLDLLFKAKSPGEASFIFVKNDIFKNDGLGTKLDLIKKDFLIKINEVSLNKEEIENQDKVYFDNNPPNPFNIFFIKSDRDNNIDNMITFEAKDQETGILEYRIKKWNNWAIVKSPYVLEYNIFPKTITIRAYDFNNNFTESSIRIEGLISRPLYWILIFMGIIASFFIHKLLKY